MQKVSAFVKEGCSNFQKRPRTGRGSQGGRQWRSLDISKEKPKTLENIEDNTRDQPSSNLGSSQETDMIWPLHVIKNGHQSGVNCLHVSEAVKDSKSRFSCNVISGGDDQAVHCYYFKVMGPLLDHYSDNKPTSETHEDKNCKKEKKYQIVFSHTDQIASAHSSAVKGETLFW